jgi:hypothetical protein
MQADQLDEVWRRCEQALQAGGAVDLRELGFWRAVGRVKRDPDLIARYAEQIGRIDQHAFEAGARGVRLGLWSGTLALVAGALAGMGMIGSSAGWRGWRRDVALLGATGLLLATTHDLAHLVVGEVVGIRFSAWFLDGPTRLQPGLKTDYASYLRCPATGRAAMHAAGAVMTKIVPFALLPLSATGLGRSALLGLGLLQIATDLLFSTRQSDWKRVRRELRVAQALANR